MINIFVSTNLNYIELDRSISVARDFTFNGTVYRILDPDYFAWLSRCMKNIKRKFQTPGDLTVGFIRVTSRWKNLEAIAIKSFGKKTIEKAIKELDGRRYHHPGSPEKYIARNTSRKRRLESPIPDPRDFRYPKAQQLPNFHPVSRYAVTQVDAIRKRALSMDWTDTELYRNQGGEFPFPYGFDWGIVNFIDRGDRLGKVTSRSIELITSAGSLLHFYKHDSHRRHTVGK